MTTIQSVLEEESRKFHSLLLKHARVESELHSLLDLLSLNPSQDMIRREVQRIVAICK